MNSVNTAIIGSYTVIYNVVDTAGNHAFEKVRTVNVVVSADTTAPVVTISGLTSIGDSGSVYTDSVDTVVIENYTVIYNYYYYKR